MKKFEAIFGLLRIPTDAAAAFAALLVSYRLREANIDLVPGIQLLEPSPTLPPLPEYIDTFVLPGVAAFLLLVACFRLYALRSTRSAWNETGRILLACLLWLVTVIGWYFLVRKQLFYSRILLMHSTFFLAFYAVIGRAAITLVERAFLACGFGVRTVVSLGAQPIIKHARTVLEDDARYHYLGHVKSMRRLQKLLKKQHVDLILETDPNPKSSMTNNLIEFCRSAHIGYAFLPPVLADNPHQLRIRRLGIVPMLTFQPTPIDGWGRILKRIGDLCISALLIIILSPVLLVTILLILLFDGFPIFYVSRRIGEQGRGEIPVLKFRTMIPDADKKKRRLLRRSHRKDGPLFKIKNDPRITPLGRVLRRWSLDELPQLFNVLLGHMSLVGPRPHLPEEVKKYSSYERRVFAVKPGITGLAQVSGRSDLPFAEEVKLDLRYVEEWSPFLDLWLLWRTVFTVLSSEGAD